MVSHPSTSASPHNSEYWYSCTHANAYLATLLWSDDRQNGQSSRLYKVARDAYERAAYLDRGNTVVTNMLAEFYLNCHDGTLRNLDLAEKYARETTRKRPDWGTGWANLAMVHYRVGHWKEAERCALIALVTTKRLGERTRILLFLALIYKKWGDPRLDKALKDACSSYDQNPPSRELFDDPVIADSRKEFGGRPMRRWRW